MSNRHQRRHAQSQSRKRASWDWQELAIDGAINRPPKLYRIVRNDLWVVQFYAFECALGPLTHLMVRSVAGSFYGGGSTGNGRGLEPSWQDLQRIKNELVGPEAEAVQCYPRDADVVDDVDMYHLFVLPPTWALPFGLHRESGFVKPDWPPWMSKPGRHSFRP